MSLSDCFVKKGSASFSVDISLDSSRHEILSQKYEGFVRLVRYCGTLTRFCHPLPPGPLSHKARGGAKLGGFRNNLLVFARIAIFYVLFRFCYYYLYVRFSVADKPCRDDLSGRPKHSPVYVNRVAYATSGLTIMRERGIPVTFSPITRRAAVSTEMDTQLPLIQATVARRDQGYNSSTEK